MQEIDVSFINNKQIPITITSENLEIGKFSLFTKYQEITDLKDIRLLCNLTLDNLNIQTGESLPEVIIINIYSLSEDKEFKTYKGDNTFVKNKEGRYEMRQTLSHDTNIPYECHLFIEICNKEKEIIELGKDSCVKLNLNISIRESKN